MPRDGTRDIAHTAMTDHRIPRSGRAGGLRRPPIRTRPAVRLLEGAAVLAGATGRRDEAVALLRRTAAVNPYCADYARRLAILNAEMSRWAEAAQSAHAALELDISLIEPRIALVVALSRLGDRAAATDELRRLRAFDPCAADALRRSVFHSDGPNALQADPP